MLSRCKRQVAHVLLTRPPLGISTSFDLHVLGMPPAFVLSQDQTLEFNTDLNVDFSIRRFILKFIDCVFFSFAYSIVNLLNTATFRDSLFNLTYFISTVNCFSTFLYPSFLLFFLAIFCTVLLRVYAFTAYFYIIYPAVTSLSQRRGLAVLYVFINLLRHKFIGKFFTTSTNTRCANNGLCA